MNVDPAESLPRKSPLLDQGQDLVVFGLGYPRQRVHEREDFLAVPKGAAGKFSKNERVDFHLAVLEKGRQSGVASPQMIDPHGAVDQHYETFRERRRGAGRSSFSVPPRAASLRALSNATSASSPA